MRRKSKFKNTAAVIFAALFLTMVSCSLDPFFIRVAFIEGVPKTGTVGTPLTLSGTVRPVFASNNAIVWIIEDAGTTGASISGNIINTTADGIVTIRAIIANGIAEGKEYTQDFKIVFNKGNAVITPINSAAINITSPVKNVEQNTGADAGGENVNYSIGEVSWSPDDNPFKGETVYTATVTLTADEGCKFPNTFTATVNGNHAAVSENTGTTVKISYTFEKTLAKAIVILTIKSPPAKMTYTAGEALNLSGLTVALIFDEGSPEDVAYSNFNAYNMTTVPAHGTPLTVAHNGQPVTVTGGGKSANTGNLTVSAGTTSVPVTGVTLNHSTLTMTAGGTETLTATIAPSNATNKNVTWSSSNTSVATVSTSGLVTAVAAGTATITVTTADGGKTAACAVTVQAANTTNTFTSIAAMAAWLAAQPANTADKPYNVKLNVSDLGGSSSTNGSAGKALSDNSRKYVSLDLSGSTITSIEDDAFFNCSNLTSVTIPNSVTNIKSRAFCNCDKLTSINIPDNVTNIGGNAFGNTNISSIYIPKSVTSIGESAFNGLNTSLTTINVDVSNNAYTAENGVLYNKNKTLLHTYPAGKTDSSFIIPNSVTSIGRTAFWYCINLTSITIPNSVTSIGINAFRYCRGLTSITIPDSVTSIGELAFGDCSKLTAINVNVSNNSYTAENGILYNKNKTVLHTYPLGKTDSSFTIPNNVTNIANYAFYNCSKLISITIPDSVTGIGNSAFSGCTDLTSVYFKRADTTIGTSAFVNADNTTSLKTAYTAGGIGTYTRPNSSSTTWTKQNTTVPVTGVTLNKSSMSLTVGNTETLTPTVNPSNATNKTVAWSTSNAAVATVNSTSGLVTAVTAGTATITVTTADGNKTATCSVTVTGGGESPVNIEMVPIPAGTFMMGSPTTEPNRSSNETQHSVTLSSFKMGKYQVTQEQYQAVIGSNPSRFTSAVDGESGTPGKLPVEVVSWYDAIVFCNKLSKMEELEPVYSISGSTDPAVWIANNGGTIPTSSNATWNGAVMDKSKNGYRLPTEAEWEYACRAGTTTAYNTGATISDNTGWYNANSDSKTHEVGLKSANAWGLYDMHGNVYEWCWDWYGSYSSSAQTNPFGAVTGSKRVARGGNWVSAENLRSAFRYCFAPPYLRARYLGFRLVRP